MLFIVLLLMSETSRSVWIRLPPLSLCAWIKNSVDLVRSYRRTWTANCCRSSSARS